MRDSTLTGDRRDRPIVTTNVGGQIEWNSSTGDDSAVDSKKPLDESDTREDRAVIALPLCGENEVAERVAIQLTLTVEAVLQKADNPASTCRL